MSNLSNIQFARSRRGEENENSEMEQHEANEWKRDCRLELQKRHRAAALHDLAEMLGRNLSRQSRACGRVRRPYAALASVRWQADFSQSPKLSASSSREAGRLRFLKPAPAVLLAIISAVLFAGCATFDNGNFANLNDSETVIAQNENEPLPVDLLDTEHKLGVGDQVSFRIVEDKDDPKKLFITDSGELEIPLVGRVRAQGKTCSQLAGEIKALLEGKYYYKATVVVSVDIMNKTRGKIYLAGRVRAPGYLEIPTDETFTVSKAILRAGGFSEFADKRHVKVTRKSSSGSTQSYGDIVTVDIAEVLEKGQSGKDFELHPDDRVFVPSRLINF